MKKKLLISLMVALVMVLVPSSVAFAHPPWDVEDPCVAESGDFIWGIGWEGVSSFSPKEEYYGGQSWSYYETPSDGYNLYRDDATDTGNLEIIDGIYTLAPEAIDLPNAIDFTAWEDNLWYMSSDASPNTWYWALEPRGYNYPSPTKSRYAGLSGVFWVEVLNFSGFDTFKWDDWRSFDRVLAEDVVAYNRVNGLICTLYIPEGTHLSYPGRPYTLVTNLFVEKDDLGDIYFEPGNMDFSQPCSLKCAYADGTEEVITFTQIRDGLPVE